MERKLQENRAFRAGPPALAGNPVDPCKRARRPSHTPAGSGTGVPPASSITRARRRRHYFAARFTFPLHGIKVVGAFHEPQRAAGILPAEERPSLRHPSPDPRSAKIIWA